MTPRSTVSTTTARWAFGIGVGLLLLCGGANIAAQQNAAAVGAQLDKHIGVQELQIEILESGLADVKVQLQKNCEANKAALSRIEELLKKE